jgi:hypothetical protein
VGTLFWQILVQSAPWVSLASGIAFLAVGLAGAFFFLRLTYRNVGAVGDRVDLSNW